MASSSFEGQTTNLVPHQLHQLQVDHSERNARLLDLVQHSDRFEVRMVRLGIGDYLIDGSILVERKTHVDSAVSLTDGRLFPQAASLAQSPHRPLVLIEGPTPRSMPAVHPHALQGAIVSLAVMWRLPVLHSDGPEDSLRILHFLANQASRCDWPLLRRYDRKPKRLASRRLFVLQGLPGVGPALAHRLLVELGSVERVVTAEEGTLTRVRGLGPKKAARIRELVR
jgi:DNA excision repair protein ERCC-4